MKKILLLCLAILTLASCLPSETTIQKAIAETQTASLGNDQSQPSYSPIPPDQNSDAIATAAFETAVAILVQTQVFANPTTTAIPTIADTATFTQAPPTVTSVQNTGNTACIPNNPPQTGKVVQVIDGDTIKVLLDQDGLIYSVRYIGMNTPEDTSKIESFGPEATAKNAKLVSGKNVTLIKDVSETDVYGRLLRYVLVDNTFVNYELVAQGYANTASYPPDIACIPTFQAAEQQALVSALGLWGLPPNQAPLPTVTNPGSGKIEPCNCNGPDLDCIDFVSHTAAQSCYDFCYSTGHGDVFRLDGDHDGLACESFSSNPTAIVIPTSVSNPLQNVTAICNDGTYSYSAHRSGTCSHHGGVNQWINRPPN